MKQMILPFPYDEDYTPASYIVTQENQQAYDKTLHPHHRLMILQGASGTGKTHLAKVWRQKYEGLYFKGEHFSETLLTKFLEAPKPVVLDDSHKLACEKNLFHLLNVQKETQMPLLLTLEEGNVSSFFSLPDLISRLKAAERVTLSLPKNDLLRALWRKFFSDAQMRISSTMVTYLERHGPRDPEKMKKIVQTVWCLLGEEKKNLTLARLKKALITSSSED